MARPKGTKYIETPEKMWELFEQFEKEHEADPITVNKISVKGDVISYQIPRPKTFLAFEVWLNKQGILNNLGDYEKNRNGSYTDYSPIIVRIKAACNKQVIEYGLVGEYNANLSARVTGTTEKNESKSEEKHEVVVRYATDRDNPS
jgi:hypothetical protein